MAGWDDFTGLGSGEIEYRLEIEGLSTVFVSATSMVGDLSDGRRRVYGLQREGLDLEEKVYIAGAKIDLRMVVAKILESPEYEDFERATVAFTTKPTTMGFLGATVTAAATSWTLKDTSRLTVGDYLHIGTEVVKVATIPTGTTMTVARGQWGTTAQAHFVEVGEDAVTPELTDVPVFLDGRRYTLSAHGPLETETTDNGTVIWRGVVGAHPELESDSVTWTITLDPVSKVLDQPIAGGLDKPFRIRGIYYAWTGPLVLNLAEYSSASATGVPANSAQVALSGFWETQAAFAAALQSAIDTATAGWDTVWRVNGEGRQWELEFVTKSTGPVMAGLREPCGSYVDGPGAKTVYDVLTMTEQPTAIASTRYRCHLGSSDDSPTPVRIVPRWNSHSYGGVEDPANETTYPANRLYLDRVSPLAAGDYLSIQSGSEEAWREFEARRAAYEYPVDTVSTASGYVELDVSETRGRIGGGSRGLGLALATNPDAIKFAKAYGDGPISLADFRDELISDAAALANTGVTPWVTADDFADWTSAVEAAANGRDFLLFRRYIFTAETTLGEVLREECKLHALYMHLDADAKITLSPVTTPTQTAVASATLDGDDHVVRTGGSELDFGTLSLAADGFINIVEIKTGYSRDEDEWLGTTYVVRDVKNISRTKQRRPLEIAPVVSGAGELDWIEAASLTNPVLTLYGGRRAQVVVNVPYIQWAALVGTAASVTLEQLPYDGARRAYTPGSGMTEIRGLIVGRKWMLDRAHGQLTILLHDSNVAGYAPTARVASQSGSGTAWTITCEASRYSPTGSVDASFFDVGDLVRLVEWDASSPIIRTGVVDAVSGNDIDLTLDASWVPGTSTWNLSYQPDTVALQAGQLLYAFIAGTDYELTEGAPARVFAP